MAYEVNILDQSWAAGADLSTKQFYAVQLTSSETITLADATVRTIGILQNTPVSGAEAQVRLIGISRAITDGSGTAIAPNDALASDANGKLVKTTTDNDEIVAMALGSSSTDGAVISVLIKSLQRY